MTQLRHDTTAAHAFTLMEVMLAMAVFAVVLVAMNGVFFSALRLRARTSAALDETATLEQALTVMRRDLAQAVPPGGVLAGSLQSGVVGGALNQNNGLELFTATGSLSDATPWGDVQKVTYQLQEAANPAGASGKDLVRGVTRNLLSITEEPEYQWLLGNVEQLEFAYYDGSTWRDSWDSTAGETNLPAAVRVRVQLAKAGGQGGLREREPIELIVPLMAQARTNAAASVQ
jgi:general secretion pathway protein J